jgi:3-oxoacyl-[acyl-carrier protein] reductase
LQLHHEKGWSFMDLGLRGRNVIVCAASEGIAFEAARQFAVEGARVAICSRDAKKIMNAAEAIKQLGADVIAEAVDVTDTPVVEGFVERVSKTFGGIDVCIMNAGGPPARMFMDTTADEWSRAFDVNLKSIVVIAQSVLPDMCRRGWGRIVTITSTTVRQPAPDLVYSNTIRAGVVGLVKSLSNEFGKHGITVNNVAPGYTATERLLSLVRERAKEARVAEEVYMQQLAKETALKRIGNAKEVADAILWLASERASFITGQTLLVDGGLYKGL